MWGHIYYNKKKEVQTGLVSGAQKTGPNGVWNSNVDGQPQFFFEEGADGLVGSTSYNERQMGFLYRWWADSFLLFYLFKLMGPKLLTSE